MADSILVVDDDILMRPSLAVALEQVGPWGVSADGAEQALTMIQVYPPEVIFLTARRTRLDQVLRQERRADHNFFQRFDLDVLLANIKATIAVQYARAAARWRQAWAPVAFAVGVLLLVLAAPQWIGWVRNVAAYERPAEDMAWNWLTNLLFDPVTTFNALLSQTVQIGLNPSGQVDAPMTLDIIVLAAASFAGLVRLLSDERKTTLPGA